MGNENSYGRPEDLETMKKYQGFTPRHIMMIKERLDLLADEDLTIDKQSFQLALKSKEDETNRKQVFQLFDLSNDGKIETLEFTCALALLSHANLYEKCEMIFGLYDFDRNRTMTKNELIILIKTVLTSLNAMTSKGECTIQEAEAMAEEILKRYDTNKDANISMKEFHSFVSKDPDILKMLLSYALISKEDLRFNFGVQSLEIPDADSDLEMEIYKSKHKPDERMERISLGIEHTFETTELEDLVLDDQNEDKDVNLESKSKFPWINQVSKFPNLNHQPQVYDSNPPSASLEIVHVYGFRGFDTRNNLKYFQNQELNELVYHCGSIGICLDSVRNTQRFFTEHTDDITCLDVGDNIAVTGQMGRQPMLCIWDLITMEAKAVLKGILKVGISNICLSNDNKKVAAIGMDDDQCIVIYDIEKAQSSRLNGRKDESLVASGKGPRSEIFDVKFDKSDKTIIIACKCEVNFVTFEGNILKVSKGVWETKTCALQSVLCIGLMDNSIVTGTFKGSLILWRGNRTTNHVEAHKGPVLSIHTRKKEIGVITGGKDGYIYYWDANLKERSRIFLGDLDISISSYRITAICENSTGSLLAIGTRGAEIIEIVNGKPRQLQTKLYLLKRKAMSGHYYGNLRGLVCHARYPYFFTVGEDSLVMKWNYKERKLDQCKKLDYQSKTLDIWEDRYLAIGCHNGNILILEPKNIQTQLHEFKDRDSEISCLKFSPEGEYLLVGYSQPYCEMFIYNVTQHFKKVSIVAGFHDNIMSMDFAWEQRTRVVMCSLHCQLLSFVDLSDDLHPRIVGNGEKHQNNTKLVNGAEEFACENWRTYTSPYGWAVQGIWPNVAEGDDINAVDRGRQSKVMVTADDYSALKLFRFPAYCQNQSYNRYTGHSNHVSNVRFTCNDEYVVSLGGMEKSIIQWKFIKDEELQASYDKSYVEEKIMQRKHQAEEDEEEDEEEGQQSN